MKRRNWNYEILLTCILKILLNNSVDINKQCAFLSFLYECKQKHFPCYIMILDQCCWRFLLRIKTVLKGGIERNNFMWWKISRIFYLDQKFRPSCMSSFSSFKEKLKITTRSFAVIRNADVYLWEIKFFLHFFLLKESVIRTLEFNTHYISTVMM